ncbi:MAG: FkbM family methyltransferase [Bacteroidota bacterium]
MIWVVRILKRLGWLRYFNFVVQRRVADRVFSIPLLGELGFVHLFSKEPWMPFILKRLSVLFPETTFVDVGVNVGQTLIVYKGVFPYGNYIGFEPNSTCVYYVRELIRVNQWKAAIFPFAIGPRSGMGILMADSVDDSAATMVEGFRENYGKIKNYVPVISGASVKAALPARVGIVKVDVEGAELEVMQELAWLIERDRPAILCEILPVYNSQNTFRVQRQQELMAYFRRWNYALFRINAVGELHSIQEIEVHSDLDKSNYLLLPSEMVGDITYE